jgi:hypothetical protein
LKPLPQSSKPPLSQSSRVLLSVTLDKLSVNDHFLLPYRLMNLE